MKVLLFIASLLLGFSSISTVGAKESSYAEKLYTVTALAAGAIHRCEGYTKEDGDKALEKFTLVTVCKFESGEMNQKEAEDFGHKLIDVFYYSRENPDIYPFKDSKACASGGRLVEKVSSIEGC